MDESGGAASWAVKIDGLPITSGSGIASASFTTGFDTTTGNAAGGTTTGAGTFTARIDVTQWDTQTSFAAATYTVTDNGDATYSLSVP